MINLADEIVAIETIIKSVLPAVKVWKQTVPDVPKANELSIRFQRGTSATETNYHYRVEHEFQIVYFGASNIDVLSKLDALNRKLNNAIKIEVSPGQFLTTDLFSMSQPFKTESGVDAAIAVLSVSLREAREQEVVLKMNEINVREETK